MRPALPLTVASQLTSRRCRTASVENREPSGHSALIGSKNSYGWVAESSELGAHLRDSLMPLESINCYRRDSPINLWSITAIS
jgi:hypothetical protein